MGYFAALSLRLSGTVEGRGDLLIHIEKTERKKGTVRRS